MNQPTTDEIREATKSVLCLIEATFGKDNEYYYALNSRLYRPRVELEKGLFYVRKLRGYFYSKENRRAHTIAKMQDNEQRKKLAIALADKAQLYGFSWSKEHKQYI